MTTPEQTFTCHGPYHGHCGNPVRYVDTTGTILCCSFHAGLMQRSDHTIFLSIDAELGKAAIARAVAIELREG